MVSLENDNYFGRGEMTQVVPENVVELEEIVRVGYLEEFSLPA